MVGVCTIGGDAGRMYRYGMNVGNCAANRTEKRSEKTSKKELSNAGQVIYPKSGQYR